MPHPRSRRLVATSVHFIASLLLTAFAALVVFVVWYPPPYAAMAGGLGLFALIVGVDVVLGPTLTAVISSPAKQMREFRRDLAVIAVVQLSALGYGLYTLALARPVWLSFEVDLFRVVTAADVEPELLGEAAPQFRQLPWSGPRLIAAVKPTDPNEQLRSIDLGLAGIHLSMLPRHWRDYASQRDAAWRAGRPVALLLTKYPQAALPLADIAARAGQPVEALRFVPLVSRQASWVTLLAGPDSHVVGHLPLDGFFS
jgi:hypothetical protein